MYIIYDIIIIRYFYSYASFQGCLFSDMPFKVVSTLYAVVVSFQVETFVHYLLHCTNYLYKI